MTNLWDEKHDSSHYQKQCLLSEQVTIKKVLCVASMLTGVAVAWQTGVIGNAVDIAVQQVPAVASGASAIITGSGVGALVGIPAVATLAGLGAFKLAMYYEVDYNKSKKLGYLVALIVTCVLLLWIYVSYNNIFDELINTFKIGSILTVLIAIYFSPAYLTSFLTHEMYFAGFQRYFIAFVIIMTCIISYLIMNAFINYIDECVAEEVVEEPELNWFEDLFFSKTKKEKSLLFFEDEEEELVVEEAFFTKKNTAIILICAVAVIGLIAVIGTEKKKLPKVGDFSPTNSPSVHSLQKRLQSLSDDEGGKIIDLMNNIKLPKYDFNEDELSLNIEEPKTPEILNKSQKMAMESALDIVDDKPLKLVSKQSSIELTNALDFMFKKTIGFCQLGRNEFEKMVNSSEKSERLFLDFCKISKKPKTLHDESLLRSMRSEMFCEIKRLENELEKSKKVVNTDSELGKIVFLSKEEVEKKKQNKLNKLNEKKLEKNNLKSEKTQFTAKKLRRISDHLDRAGVE